MFITCKRPDCGKLFNNELQGEDGFCNLHCAALHTFEELPAEQQQAFRHVLRGLRVVQKYAPLAAKALAGNRIAPFMLEHVCTAGFIAEKAADNTLPYLDRLAKKAGYSDPFLMDDQDAFTLIPSRHVEVINAALMCLGMRGSRSEETMAAQHDIKNAIEEF